MKNFKEHIKETTNASSAGVGSVGIGYDGPLFKKKGKAFDVDSEVFRRFQTGRNKFERWSKFLNLVKSSHKAIYDYATRNRNSTIILRDATTGAMKAIRTRSSNNL